MNMKFMKFSQPQGANGGEKPTDEASQKSAVPDSSKWDLKTLSQPQGVKKPRKKTIVAKRRVNVRSNVSITDVKRESNPIVRGRRTVGEVDNQESSKRPRGDTENDDYDLDKILKQVKSPR